MNNQRVFIGIVFICIVTFAIIWGYIFYQNYSIEKVVKKMEGTVLEQAEIGDQTFVIFDTDDFIEGGIFERGIFGWKITTNGRAIRGHNSDIPFSIDYYAITPNINGWSYFFGYVNPNKVDIIRFQSNNLDIEYQVESYYWFIPVLNYKGSFKPKEFSVILKDGKEIFYPFDELK
ncbi:hypothetical protein ACFSTA_04760 [Ornithinibacillus salinisoli]|uniref:Uncharacterized protein n=1 Tax=Ornithinibacillus salinisoli TaxID=1848459 RepID=A0ABW4VYN8_9BACI